MMSLFTLSYKNENKMGKHWNNVCRLKSNDISLQFLLKQKKAQYSEVTNVSELFLNLKSL